jgi:hypothetical protein
MNKLFSFRSFISKVVCADIWCASVFVIPEGCLSLGLYVCL